MKILIAEDDFISRMILKKALTGIGHEVIEAEDGKRAWQFYLEHGPDLVITDWMMPEMDGIGLCRKIRTQGKKTYAYLIVLTTRNEIADLVHVFDAGADDYMVKPVNPDELRSRIKTGERIISLEKDHLGMQAKLIKNNKALDKALAELKTTQSRMLQSEKMASIGQLAAGVAHEINNPIGFIGGNIDALADYFTDMSQVLSLYQDLLGMMTRNKGQVSPDLMNQIKIIEETQESIDLEYLKEDIPDLLKDCNQGTRRVANIVNDLKNFAHPGNPRQKLFDINSGIRSTLNVIWNELKYKVKVDTDLGEVDSIEGFPQKLNQAFMNILINAGQAIEHKGEIKIKTRQEGSHVIVSISDTGTGIEPENISRIFDPFFSTRGVGGGTGLGLTLAYNIIKEHKGKIEVESRVGRGTCFTITLPGGKR